MRGQMGKNIKKHVIYTCFCRIHAAIRWIVRTIKISQCVPMAAPHSQVPTTAEFRCSRYFRHYMVFFRYFRVRIYFLFRATIQTEFWLWHVLTGSTPSWVLPAFTSPLPMDSFSFIVSLWICFAFHFNIRKWRVFLFRHTSFTFGMWLRAFFVLLPFAVGRFGLKCRSDSDKSKIEFAIFRHVRLGNYLLLLFSTRDSFLFRRNWWSQEFEKQFRCRISHWNALGRTT